MQQSCNKSHLSFSLLKQQKIILSLSIASLLSITLSAQTFDIQNNWKLLGAMETLDVSKFDDKCVDFVWKYVPTDTANPWKLHIANGQTYAGATNFATFDLIENGEGFWIKGNDSCEINTEINSKTIVIWKDFEYQEIISPYTNRIWLDRNLGATEVCDENNNLKCYGDYYQWGRLSDGHQFKTSLLSVDSAVDIFNTNDKFIMAMNSYYKDWTYQDNNATIRENNWNICPVNFRVPTISELKDETINIGIANIAELKNHFLKLPITYGRDGFTSNLQESNNKLGLWSSQKDLNNINYMSSNIYFDEYSAYNTSTYRINALPVRCIKKLSTDASKEYPIANAGSDLNTTNNVLVTFDASKSFDNDGSIMKYEWKENGIVLSNTKTFSLNNMSLGEHIITLYVMDNDNLISFSKLKVTISSQPFETEDILYKNKIYKTIQSLNTGKVWLDRNLGANRICNSLDDIECYGNYYQWGRLDDGHELVMSTTTTTKLTSISSTNKNFILSDSDWTTADQDGVLRSNILSKIDGTSVCPINFRVPTKDEIDKEINYLSLGANSSEKLFESFLKFPSAGYRSGELSVNGGKVKDSGTSGWLWSSTPNQVLGFSQGSHGFWSMRNKNNGYMIRCIKN